MARKALFKRNARSFGLECLERRTVMAGDLFSIPEVPGGCLASEIDDAQTVVQSTPSFERSVQEISNTPISLLQDDLIEIGVPNALLFDYTSLGSYALRVAYAENYFSFLTGASALDDNALDRSGYRDALDTLPTDSVVTQDSRLANEQVVRADSQSPKLSNNSGSFDSYSMFLLASLTATQDFDGTVRVFDYADGMLPYDSKTDVDRLPSEIRIEPKITAPTALRDPGPTIVKTIVVNRVANGLTVSEAPTTPTTATASQDVKPQPDEESPSTTPQEVTPARQNRSVINVKTLDISQVRRNETTRPWMRSTTVPNPSHRKDFGFHTEPAAEPQAQPGSTVDSEANVKPLRKANIPTSGTKLVPVEFLLSKNFSDLEQPRLVQDSVEMATDQAIREYMDEADHRLDSTPLEQLRDLGLIAAARLQTKETSTTWKVQSDDDTDRNWRNAVALSMQGAQVDGGAKQESWKRALKFASESTAGQMVLASLSALAVQQGETNAFGSKSAWEFVVKPPRSRLV